MTEHVSVGRYGWEKDHNQVRRNLIREMNRIGAHRIEGEYAGGHDEGGLEYLQAFDGDDNLVSIEGNYDHPLWAAVEDLLSTKFYTWALENYVNGKVYVDLKKKRAWTEGEEEVSRYEEDMDPIDMSW